MASRHRLEMTGNAAWAASPNTGLRPTFAGFTPLQLKPVLWLLADRGLYQDSGGTTPAMADGDPIGLWQDQSGHGNHVTQTTSADRPALKRAIQNGQNVVRFDGTSTWLSQASPQGFSGETGQTILVVTSRSAADAFGMIVVTHEVKREFRCNSSGVTPEWLIDDGVGTLDFGSASSGWHCYHAQFDQSAQASSLDVDGAGTVTSPDTSSLASYPSNVLEVGSRGGADFYAGDIGEVVVCNYPLPAWQLSAWLAYARSRWGTP